MESWLEATAKCQYLPEKEFKQLCDIVKDILVGESNVHPVTSPVTVCGDVHGQYYDVMELFRIGGSVPDTKYIFMGDFVDRGYYSVETLTRLLVLKAAYPSHVTLLRGNHESRVISQVYGFYTETLIKYGNANIWRWCCEIFDLLPIAALIDEEVFCVHGGLSPDIVTIDQIRTLERNVEVPQDGPLCDLLWSDPSEDISSWDFSPRNAGWLFGKMITQKFNLVNKLSLICRAHQLVDEGFKFMFNAELVTIWSAPNYFYRCGNVASIIEFEDALNFTTKVFKAVPIEQREKPEKVASPYFL